MPEPHSTWSNSVVERLLKERDDLRQLALSYEAQVEQQAQQIGALRAEQARLRAQLAAVKGKVATTLVDDEYQALLRWRRVFLDFTVQDVEPEKLRAPQNQLVCYAIADAMTLRDIDEVLSAETPSEDDGKSARDNSPAFSQVDMDTATKPLHYQIEQLRAENERLKAGWQPIETAPKQRVILLFAVTEWADDYGGVLNWKMATGSWHHAYESELVVWTWDGHELKSYDHQPTHWMPLPEAPSTQGED